MVVAPQPLAVAAEVAHLLLHYSMEEEEAAVVVVDSQQPLATLEAEEGAVGAALLP